MEYLIMDPLLIKADLACLTASKTPVSFNIVEPYNLVISLDYYKGYFESLVRQSHKGCTIVSITMRISQTDEKGETVIDPAAPHEKAPLWHTVYPQS